MYSADPTTIAWSKIQFSEGNHPTSIQGLAEAVQANPDQFTGRLTTYSLPEYLTVYWPFVKAHAPEGGDWRAREAWEWVEILCTHTQALSSTGQIGRESCREHL